MNQEEKTRMSIEQIINAAIPEFIVKGYEGAVLNDICRNNGISKGKFFHHFKGKDDLFVACCRSVCKNLADNNLRFQPNPDKNLQDNIHDYFVFRNTFFLKKKGVLDMGLFVQRNDIPKFKTELHEIYEATKKVNISVLRRIFDKSQHPLPETAFLSIVNSFYIAQSHLFTRRIISNSLYLMSEHQQREVLNEYVTVTDAVIDTLLYGIYPRENGEPKCFSLFSDKENIWNNLLLDV